VVVNEGHSYQIPPYGANEVVVKLWGGGGGGSSLETGGGGSFAADAFAIAGDEIIQVTAGSGMLFSCWFHDLATM
jgi:hypothetical protein